MYNEKQKPEYFAYQSCRNSFRNMCTSCGLLFVNLSIIIIFNAYWKKEAFGSMAFPVFSSIYNKKTEKKNIYIRTILRNFAICHAASIFLIVFRIYSLFFFMFAVISYPLLLSSLIFFSLHPEGSFRHTWYILPHSFFLVFHFYLDLIAPLQTWNGFWNIVSMWYISWALLLIFFSLS